jgi:uncharacterized protein YkwD
VGHLRSTLPPARRALLACALATGALAALISGASPRPALASRHAAIRSSVHARHAACSSTAGRRGKAHARRSSFHARGGRPHGTGTHRRHARVGCPRRHGRPNHRTKRRHGRHTVRHGRHTVRHGRKGTVRHGRKGTVRHGPGTKTRGPGIKSPHAAGGNHAAHSSTCPDADLTPSPEDLDRIRAATLCLINRERTVRGESALVPNGTLEQSAQAHSEDMSSADYFEHVGPRGDTPLSRMRAAGYIFSSQIGYEIGENIAWGTLWLATPRSIVSGWMASPGHRANILDGRFRDTAIGVSPQPPASLAHGQPGAIYTQDFGVIIFG